METQEVVIQESALAYIEREVTRMGHEPGEWLIEDGEAQTTCERCDVAITYDPRRGNEAIQYVGEFDFLIGCIG